MKNAAVGCADGSDGWGEEIIRTLFIQPGLYQIPSQFVSRICRPFTIFFQHTILACCNSYSSNRYGIGTSSLQAANDSNRCLRICIPIIIKNYFSLRVLNHDAVSSARIICGSLDILRCTCRTALNFVNITKLMVYFDCTLVLTRNCAIGICHRCHRQTGNQRRQHQHACDQSSHILHRFFPLFS